METPLAVDESILETHHPSQDYEPEDIYSAMDDAPVPAPEAEHELELYGPGDYKGKGKDLASASNSPSS